MKKFIVLIVSLIITVTVSRTNRQVYAAPPTNFQTTQIIGSGLYEPTAFDFAPDGRIFILERTGGVRVYKNGALLNTPFTTLPSVDTGDRGLMGIAFDPDFTTNHYIYLYYTGMDLLNHLVRMDASGDTASGPTTSIYDTITPSNELHVGGTIRFGPDGKLYLSVGDNGNPPNSQSLSNPHGKILRMNKDGSIPTDNPFYGQNGKEQRIWAYGFRNPFRFQFDKVTGRLYEGDVGQATWEEVNLVQKGGNYGWPTCEGTCNTSGMINPIHTYNHNGQSAAIAMGPVYQGNMFPSYFKGALFYGDYALGFIRDLSLDSNGNKINDYSFDSSAGAVVDMKEAADGSLYYVSYYPEKLYRITYSTGNQVPVAKSAADVTQGNSPLTVHFSSAGTNDPDNDPITYLWNFGDNTFSNDPNPTKTYSQKGTYVVTLSVSDGPNTGNANPITIKVGSPPVITITSPVDNSTYKAGDTINFNATALDSQGNPLPDSAFTTEILFHHQTHTHPFYGPIQTRSGSVVIPTSGEPSWETWFEFKITAKDQSNVSALKSVNIYPVKSNLTFQTQPAGLQVLLEGQTTNTPVTIPHVVGFQRVLSTQILQELNGDVYQFTSWSDGGAPRHTITTPNTDTTYTANFTQAPTFNGEYFNNINLSGNPTVTRQDKKIDFDWGLNSPVNGINTDNFSVRWTKQQSFAAGKYVFLMTSDDGARLYIDNQLVIDKWIDQSATKYETTQSLTGGNHTLKMEYYEHTEDALAKLTWDLAPDDSSISPTPTPTPVVGTNGLTATYFNNMDFTGTSITRTDAQVDFGWALGAPANTIDPETFSVRWTGQLLPKENENYTFYTKSDDGVRLWVNNQLIIDNWTDHSEVENTGVIALQGNQKVNIKMEFYDNTYDATARLSWSSPSQVKQIIPNSQLFTTTGAIPTPTNTPTPTPSPTPMPPATGDGLKGIYYDNKDFTGTSLTRIDPTINFDWGVGSPISGIGADTFSVRWTGFIIPQYSETYTFYSTTDDGVRLWVNNQQIINKWVDQSAKEWTGTITLTAGQKYPIKLEYYENGGGAVSKLSWSSTSQAKQIIPKARLFSL